MADTLVKAPKAAWEFTPVPDLFRSGAIMSVPELSTLGSQGYPTAGDPAKGVPATVPGAAWYYLMSQMRLSVIAAAGLDPLVPPDPGQFLAALRSMKWMLDGSILGTMLAAGTIPTAAIADKAITQALLADGAVNAAKLAASAVEAAKIKDGAVTAAKLAANAVEAAKIKDGVITFAKLAETAIASTDDVKAGTSGVKIVTPAALTVLMESQANLTGFVCGFAGKTVPAGWLPCNGGAVSREAYAALFEVLGTLYGEGNGTTTFNLPNFESGRFMEFTQDPEQVGVKHDAEAPNITGGASFYGTEEINDTAGALFYESAGTHGYGGHSSGTKNYPRLFIDAWRSSSLYQGGTLQPAAMKYLPCIHV